MFVKDCFDPRFPWDTNPSLPATLASVEPADLTFHTDTGPSSTTVHLTGGVSSLVYIGDALVGSGASPVCTEVWFAAYDNRIDGFFDTGLDVDWQTGLASNFGVGASTSQYLSTSVFIVGRIAVPDAEVSGFEGVCVPPSPLNVAVPEPVVADVVPWALQPDWANGVTERLSWKTDVLPSQTGIEQRRRLRNAPRRQIEAAFTLFGAERRLYDAYMRGPGAGYFHTPLWWEKTFLNLPASIGDTALYCVGADVGEMLSQDTIMLIGATPFITETATVASVNADGITLTDNLARAWPTGTAVYLTKRCRLISTQRGNRRGDDAYQVTLTFETTEPNDFTGVTPPTVFDAPGLTLLPNEAEDLTTEYTRLLAEFDNETARVPLRRDLAGVPFEIQQFSYLVRGRAELVALRGLLYWLEGRLKPLYVPTFFRDVEMMPFTFNDGAGTTMSVRRSGYADFDLDDGRRLLMIWFKDGTIGVLDVASIEVVDDDEELITFTGSPGRPLGTSLVSRMCFMTMSRQDQDDVEILHHTEASGAATMTTTFKEIRLGRVADVYSLDIFNGSYVQIDGIAINPPPVDASFGVLPDPALIYLSGPDVGSQDGGDGGSGQGNDGSPDAGSEGGSAGQA